jgi:hypothetical protein
MDVLQKTTRKLSDQDSRTKSGKRRVVLRDLETIQCIVVVGEEWKSLLYTVV